MPNPILAKIEAPNKTKQTNAAWHEHPKKEKYKKIEYYAHRWKIEYFHFILKSECKIEKNQARKYKRLKFLTLLYSVIAMQILNLTYLGKICLEISSKIVFGKDEWRVLYCCSRKTKEIPPDHIHLKK